MPNTQPIWGFWDALPSQQPLSTQQRTQLALWAASLRYAHPDSTVTVWTRRSVIPPEYVTVGSDLEQSGVRIAYFNHVSELFRDTPLDTYAPPEQLSKAELSDIVRLALLYTYGGTWVDIDDITIRPFTTQRNVLDTLNRSPLTGKIIVELEMPFFQWIFVQPDVRQTVCIGTNQSMQGRRDHCTTRA